MANGKKHKTSAKKKKGKAKELKTAKISAADSQKIKDLSLSEQVIDIKIEKNEYISSLKQYNIIMLFCVSFANKDIVTIKKLHAYYPINKFTSFQNLQALYLKYAVNLDIKKFFYGLKIFELNEDLVSDHEIKLYGIQNYRNRADLRKKFYQNYDLFSTLPTASSVTIEFPITANSKIIDTALLKIFDLITNEQITITKCKNLAKDLVKIANSASVVKIEKTYLAMINLIFQQYIPIIKNYIDEEITEIIAELEIDNNYDSSYNEIEFYLIQFRANKNLSIKIVEKLFQLEINSNLPKEIKIQTFSNIISYIYFRHNVDLALEYSQKANTLFPQEDIFKYKIYDCYLTKKDYQKALHITSKLEDRNLAKILFYCVGIILPRCQKQILKMGYNSLAELGISDDGSDEYKSLNIKFQILKENIDNSLRLLDNLIAITKNKGEHWQINKLATSLIFILIVHPNQYDQEIYQYLTKIRYKYPEFKQSTNIKYTYLKLVMTLRVEPEQFETVFQDANLPFEQVRNWLCELYALHLVENKKYTKLAEFLAKKWINSSGVVKKFEAIIKYYKLTEPKKINSAKITSAKICEVTQQASDEELLADDELDSYQQEIIIESLETSEDFTEISEISPQIIHSYCQWKNQQLTKKILQKNLNTASWQVTPQISLTSLEVVKIGENIYAYISEDLDLDTIVLNQFETALGKGIVGRQYGKNGVKFIKNKLFELKINADIRLYSDKIYIDPQGNKLIIFDQQANHQEISRILNNIKKIKIHKVDIVQKEGNLSEEDILQMFAAEHPTMNEETLVALKEVIIPNSVLDADDLEIASLTGSTSKTSDHYE